MENLTASRLKDSLWETLNKVKDGTMQPAEADSVATQAREILRTTNTQLKIVSQAGRQVPTEVIDFAEGKS